MKYVETSIEKGIGTLTLHRGKVNPINHNFVKDLRDAFDWAQSQDNIRGVILTGNTDGYFSVGLDIKEIYNYDEEEISAFWEDWDAMIIELVSFDKPVIAAINGHSPAGGCVLALTCDYRLMADSPKYLIGLNEVGVGIVVPTYIYQLFSFWCGSRHAYQSLLKAKLFSPAEAKAINLVDDIVPMDELYPKAIQTMSTLIAAPSRLLRQSKKNMRAQLIRQVMGSNKVSRKDKLSAWFDPESRKVMKAIIDQLTRKS